LHQGVLLGDGAMGTYLHQLGLPIHMAYEELNVSRPDVITDVHRAYVAAGARVLETNTFSANSENLDHYGLADRVAKINAGGVQAARAAGGAEAYVVGAIGAVRAGKKLNMRAARLAEVFTEQMAALLEAGVDGLLLETFYDLEELLIAVQAARALDADVPLIAQFAVVKDVVTRDGVLFRDAFARLQAAGADVAGFNCHSGPLGMRQALATVAGVAGEVREAALPFSVYPNAGLPDFIDGKYVYSATPEYFAAAVPEFVGLGARLLGGCCGTTPAHIAAMAAALRTLEAGGDAGAGGGVATASPAAIAFASPVREISPALDMPDTLTASEPAEAGVVDATSATPHSGEIAAALADATSAAPDSAEAAASTSAAPASAEAAASTAAMPHNVTVSVATHDVSASGATMDLSSSSARAIHDVFTSGATMDVTVSSVTLTEQTRDTDANDVPPTGEKNLVELVRERVTVIVELDPPRDLSIGKFMQGAERLRKAGVDALTMADNSLAMTRMSNLALGALIKERLGMRPLVHITCRDRNLIGTQSHLMGIDALGIDHILAVTGDPTRFGDLPDSSAVYDLTSFEMIRMIKQLNDGVAFSGKPLKQRARFLIGAAFNPNVTNLDRAVKRMEKKISIGADYFMTQPVYSAEVITELAAATQHITAPIFVGIMPLASGRNAEYLHNEVPGITLAPEVRQRMAGLSGAAGRAAGVAIARELIDAALQHFNGIYLMTPFTFADMTAELTEYAHAVYAQRKKG
jgi:methionine synthase I (cobalamin-dependent)/5,10-methylenetetrahydrofolate reductase